MTPPSPIPNGSRIVGDGPMSALIRRHDWRSTALGPLDTWSGNLICSVNLMLACAFPSLLFWGPDLVQLYNEAFRPLIGEKHPLSLGQTAPACWSDAWSIIGPQLEAVLTRGETISRHRVLVPVLREGRLQDVWWNYSYSPVFASDATIAGILVVCQDISREVTEIGNVRASEERLRLSLAAAGGVGVWDWDIPADRAHIDPGFARLYGIDPDRASSGVPSAEFRSHIHPDDRPFLESALRQTLRDGTEFSCEYRVIQPHGLPRWLFSSGRCDYAPNGSPLYFRGVTIDISERKRTEEALRESEARLNSIYSTSLEYIGILSPEGRILDCNRASLEFAGNSREELLGTDFWDGPWFAGTPGMPEIIRGAANRAAAGQSFVTEVSLVRPSGETIPFDFSLTPVFDGNGRVVFLVPEGRDLQTLKRAQHALMESEKIAAVGRLASSIAHEINNPLEAVTNLLYLARQKAALPQVQEFLQAADHELRRVSAIANQTLRFHRQASHPESVTAEDLFSTVLSIYEGRLRNSRISIEVRHRVRQPVVCFQGDVRQVLNNLVANAIDAMPGGGRLLIRSRLSTDWSTRREGVVFTVADTGCGMSAATRRRIFEPFFTTKGMAGTGLGMWVSQEVVQRHRGTLRVRSSQLAMSQGTVFRLFLPFAGCAAAASRVA